MTYEEIYQNYRELIRSHSASMLNKQRDRFFELWSEAGFPTRKTEAYRYINLDQPLAVDYGMNLGGTDMPVDARSVFHCDVPGIASHLCFVVGDRFDRTLRPADSLPEGVLVCSLQEACEAHPELVEPYLNRLAERTQDPFVWFNGAFAQDGLFVYVPDGVRLDRPVQLINIMHGRADMMANSHNLIVIGREAEAKLLVCDHSMEQDLRFCATRTTEVFVGPDATYDHYKLESTSQQTCNVCNLLVDQAAGSSFTGNIITLHNGLSRNNILIDQNGEHCHTLLCGMAIADGTQVDNYTCINHNHPNGESNELFKYILGDQARGVFYGKLTVKPGAQKTAAYQTNRNMLLQPTAEVRTRPQLEIYADDVKCSHGATTGQLDEEALFYMRQRGISEHEAKLMLMQAFVDDVVRAIRIPALEERIRLLVEKRLRGDSRRGCDNCRKLRSSEQPEE